MTFFGERRPQKIGHRRLVLDRQNLHSASILAPKAEDSLKSFQRFFSFRCSNWDSILSGVQVLRRSAAIFFFMLIAIEAHAQETAQMTIDLADALARAQK